MKKLPKIVIEIVKNCAGNLENAPKEDSEFVIAQIDRLYKNFCGEVIIQRMWITSNPIGYYTADGQYGKGNFTEAVVIGTYCFPIEDGKYLAIDYTC